MNNVIDNIGDNTLSAKLKDILPDCDRVDALVAYFYFSGFRDLHDDLKDKHIRILVGMDIDPKVLEKISSFNDIDLSAEVKETEIGARSKVRDNYIEEFSRIFNETDYFDTGESERAFKMFLGKIEDGSLEIKKTPEANHTKLYILHKRREKAGEGNEAGVIIGGSSNLSSAGLGGRRERNWMPENQYEDDAAYFESEWNNPDNISIVDIDSSAEFIEKVKSRIWLYSLPEPLLMYYRVLDEYFSIKTVESAKTPYDITGGKYVDLKYQKDAIDLGMDRIKRFGGVIIADVVGLGKSIIASAIAHNMGCQTVIIAPPHLETQWKDYINEFDFKGFFYSTGKIQEAFERHGKDKKDLLIILDEAHKHRNEDTENYKVLHRLCAGNAVMALSATPFNNDPKDIYALIKLFSTPGQSTIKTVENLSMAFHELIRRYKKVRRVRDKDENEKEIKSIADTLRNMIEPLVIRRSRLDLEDIEDYREDLKRQGVSFPTVRDPELLEYKLGDISRLYADTLNSMTSSFDGVRYKSAQYLNPESKYVRELIDDDDENGVSAEDRIQSIAQAQRNVSQFMRRLLVRRFESSVDAFYKSLKNLIESSETILDWYDVRGVVPIYKKGSLPTAEHLESMDEKERDEEINKLKGRGLINIPVSEMRKSFRDDLKKDITILRNIRSEWERVTADPKYDFFMEKITSSLRAEPNRKIIVFTEFSDTADYLYKKISEEGVIRVFKHTSADAKGSNKDTIRKNFDAGLEESEQKNDFDVLIATDSISEGHNLHRAGTIINYDIPYNPTRVIQRIGRINRINKKVFDELFIYNFFPTPAGEEEVKTRAISKLKMDMIHNLLGEDTRVFASDEELNNYFTEPYREELEESESRSWDARYRNDWGKIKDNKEIMEKVRGIPHRARIARSFSSPGVVAFAKRDGNYVFAYGKDTESVEIVSPEVGLRLFNQIADGEKALETTKNFDPVYAVAKDHLFRDNTKPPVGGKRKKEALDRMWLMIRKHPLAKELCLDVVRLIKELDALPVVILRQIASLTVKKDPAAAYGELLEIVPTDYIEDIITTSKRAAGNGKLVVLSEELVPYE